MAIIISHTKDLDGIASAAILLRENPSSRLFLIDYDDEYVAMLDRRLQSTNGETVVIADIGCNRRALASWSSLLSRWKASGSRILWLDHHEWDSDCVDAVLKGLDLLTWGIEGKCAAEIVLERAGNQRDYVERRLAELAHDSDFNLWREPLSKPLSRLISYYHYIGGDRGDELKQRLAALLSSGVFWTAWMDAELKEYEGILRRDEERLLRLARVVEVNGLKVVVSLKGAFSGTDAANLLFERIGGDVAIVVSGRGHLSIRSNREDVNAKAIGEAFGGGGHLRHAAGGSIEEAFPQVDEGNFDSVVEHVVSRLSKVNLMLGGGS